MITGKCLSFIPLIDVGNPNWHQRSDILNVDFQGRYASLEGWYNIFSLMNLALCQNKLHLVNLYINTIEMHKICHITFLFSKTPKYV